MKKIIMFILSGLLLSSVYSQKAEKIGRLPVDKTLFFSPGYLFGSAAEVYPDFSCGPRAFTVKNGVLTVKINPNHEDMYEWIRKNRDAIESGVGSFSWVDEIQKKCPSKTYYYLSDENGNFKRCIRPDDAEEITNEVTGDYDYYHKINSPSIKPVNERKYFKVGRYIGSDDNKFEYSIAYGENEYIPEYHYLDVEIYVINPANGKMYCTIIPSEQFYTYAVSEYRNGETDWAHRQYERYSVDHETGDFYMMNLSDDKKYWEVFKKENTWTQLLLAEDPKESEELQVVVKTVKKSPVEETSVEEELPVKKEKKKKNKKKDR